MFPTSERLQTVDRALVSGVPEQKIIEVRKVEIGREANQSIWQSGCQPDLFANIVLMAIRVLKLLIVQVINLTKKFVEKMEEESTRLEQIPSVRWSEQTEKVTEVLEEEIPDRLKKSARVVEYPRLKEIYMKLQQQNKAIFQKEQNLRNLEMELQECKGNFKGKRRKELRGEIEQAKEQLESMKQRVTDIVTLQGYKNVRAFLVKHQKSRAEYEWY